MWNTAGLPSSEITWSSPFKLCSAEQIRKVVLADLREIRISPRFAGDCNAFGICARFYYTLGLAYELTGDQLNATGSYLTVWRTYPFSPIYSDGSKLSWN